ncbi:hypothetical protein BDY21DRAFT_274230, partial [Lineolata rhizophorae]
LAPTADDDDADRWDAGGRDSKEETKSSWYLFLLTLTAGGLQISWSVEMSNVSPYLLSLGLSKSLLALVWIAGPLSGTLVQPYVGIKSDNCRIRWGRRRPFIVGGAAATIVCLMCLAWAREIVGGFLSIFGVDTSSTGVATAVIAFAVVFVYVLDFAINVIQAGIRAYVVDCAPTHQQEAANAWVIRSSGVGNIIGFLSGYVNLPQLFPFLGNTQFKVLCAIACIVLAVTVAISCSTVHERDPRLDGGKQGDQPLGVIAFFKSLYRSVRRLPDQIKRVCIVQLAAWIGWFPFLFYITTYIGEIYAEPYFAANPNMSKEEIDRIWEEATRVGTLGLLIFAITTFIASVFLPFVIAPTFKVPIVEAATTLEPALAPATNLTGGHALTATEGSSGDSSSHSAAGSSTQHPPSKHRRHGPHRRRGVQAWLDRQLSKLQIPGLTLRRAWLLSHFVFAVCMFLTFFTHTPASATALVAVVGIPWALTNWAPFALIASDVSKRDAIRRGLVRAPRSRDGALLAAGEDDGADGAADQAGVVLGIHNVAIAAPQVVATLLSSAIFRALQKPRGEPGDDSVAWVLRLGGVCALGAAWLARRVHEE